MSVSSLLWVESVPATAVVLFGLGIGWNLSFVAATAQLADCASAAERGKLLGFNDLLAGLTGAGLALLGGVALSAIGVAALAIGGTVLVILPAVWILHAPAACTGAPVARGSTRAAPALAGPRAPGRRATRRHAAAQARSVQGR